MHIILRNNSAFQWTSFNRVRVKGYLYSLQGILYQGLELAKLFASAGDLRTVNRMLAEVNGCFAIILSIGNELIAAVDVIRSIPLYYAVRGQDIWISEDAEKIRELLTPPLSRHHFDEMLLTGYVTGDCTVYRGIHQVEAGSCLAFKYGQITVSSYSSLTHDGHIHKRAYCSHDINAVIDRSICRLIGSLNNRPVAIPLSGGYDSRLLAVKLKEYGYHDITTFTYGARNSWEVRISKEVAAYLGLRWLYIPYSFESWHDWFALPERRGYFQYAHHCCSLPHIQDWPAVRQLSEQHLIADDCIFIPGHTAFLSFAGYDFDDDIALVCRKLVDKHYVLFGDSYAVRRFKKRKIEQMLNLASSEAEPIDFFYEWEMNERHAKYINHSVRVYEFFGYEWRLPLWDRELVQLWSSTIPEQRKGKRILKECVQECCQLPVTPPNPPRRKIERYLARITDPDRGRYAKSTVLVIMWTRRNRDLFPRISHPFFQPRNLSILEDTNTLNMMALVNESYTEGRDAM